MIRFAIALLVGGGFLTFFGFNEHKLASAADSEPQTISAADLIANGPGENAHVTVTDAYILESFYAYYYEDSPNTLEDVYIPMVSMDDPWAVKVGKLIDDALEKNPDNPDFSALENVGTPDSVKAVIHSDELKNEAAVDDFAFETEFTGLVMFDKLESETYQGLRDMYPSLAGSDDILVVAHNRKPKSTGTTMLMMVGGVVLMLAGPALFFFGKRQ